MNVYVAEFLKKKIKKKQLIFPISKTNHLKLKRTGKKLNNF